MKARMLSGSAPASLAQPHTLPFVNKEMYGIYCAATQQLVVTLTPISTQEIVVSHYLPFISVRLFFGSLFCAV
jgi:hypothetical protein